MFTTFNPLNAELTPIHHSLALVGARHIVHFSKIRVKSVHISRKYNFGDTASDAGVISK